MIRWSLQTYRCRPMGDAHSLACSAVVGPDARCTAQGQRGADKGEERESGTDGEKRLGLDRMPSRTVAMLAPIRGMGEWNVEYGMRPISSWPCR